MIRTASFKKSKKLSHIHRTNPQTHASSSNDKNIRIKPFKFCIILVFVFQFTCFILYRFVDIYNHVSPISIHQDGIPGIPPNVFTTLLHNKECKHRHCHWNYNHFNVVHAQPFVATFFESSFNSSHITPSFLLNLSIYYDIDLADLWGYVMVYEYGGMYLNTYESPLAYNQWTKLNFPYNNRSDDQIPAIDFDPATDIDMIIGIATINTMQFTQSVFLSKTRNPILHHVLSSVMHAQPHIDAQLWSSSILEFISMHVLDLNGVKEVQLEGCNYQYDGAHRGYLTQCITATGGHCVQYKKLNKAQRECNQEVRCVGITRTVDHVYEMRVHLPLIKDRNQRFKSWIKRMDRNTTEYCRRRTRHALPKVLFEPQYIHDHGQLISLYYKQQRLYLLILPHSLLAQHLNIWKSNRWRQANRKLKQKLLELM
eukprot:277755_1